MYKSCRLFPWNEYDLAKETPQEIIFNIVVCLKKKFLELSFWSYF